MLPRHEFDYHCTCPSNQTITIDFNPFDKKSSDHDIFCNAQYPGPISSKLTKSSSLNTLLKEIGDSKQFRVSLRNIVETAENLLTAFEGVLKNGTVGSINSSTRKSIPTVMAPRAPVERDSEDIGTASGTQIYENQQERHENTCDGGNNLIKSNVSSRKPTSDVVGTKHLGIPIEGYTIGRNRTTQNDCHRDHTNLSIQPNKIKCTSQGQHPAGPIQNQEAKDNNDYDDDDDYDEIDNDNDNCECDESSDQYFTPRGAYLFGHEEANLPIFCDQQISDRMSNDLQINKPGSTVKVSSHIPEGSFECISKFCSEQGDECVQASLRDMNLTSPTSSKIIQDLKTNPSPPPLDQSNLLTPQVQIPYNSSAVEAPSKDSTNEKVVSLLENIYEVLNCMRSKEFYPCGAMADQSELSRTISQSVPPLNSKPNTDEPSSDVKWLDSRQYLDQSESVEVLEPPERDNDVSGRTTKRLIPVDMDLLRTDEAFEWLSNAPLGNFNKQEIPSSSNFHQFGVRGLSNQHRAPKSSRNTTIERTIKNSSNIAEQLDSAYALPSTHLDSKRNCFGVFREYQNTESSESDKFESEEHRNKYMALLDSFGYKWAHLSKRVEMIAQRLQETTPSYGNPSDCRKEPEHTTPEQVQVNISFMQCLTLEPHQTHDLKESLLNQNHDDGSTKVMTPQIRMIENDVYSSHAKENVVPRSKNDKLDLEEIELPNKCEDALLKTPPNSDEISFVDSSISDLEVIQKIPDNPQRFQNMVSPPTQPYSEPLPKLTEGFPVSMTKVEALGTNSLFVKWKIHSFLNVGGYEVFLDGHLTNRYFSCIHRAAVICDVNLQFSHKIVLRAQPLVQQQNHKQTPSLACNLEASSRQPDGSTWHPSVYYYEPNSSSAPQLGA